MAPDRPMSPCPCGRADYSACCGRYHGGLFAPDAESLMRSRYSAFVLGLPDYLLASWHPSTRPSTLDLDPGVRWLGLDIKKAAGDGNQATVEFVARSRHGGGPAHRQHELSRFVHEDGRWFYLDGDVR
ncbi:YchJ family protein [Pinirhizobacter soli]|uniref:YchJ family protein n=1 Tax=Pinirhizobacter soli TaxID=2786953 RepID=UPI00202A9791|nr:YchJ family metal-binding protein [Pinirhizobacter soli]